MTTTSDPTRTPTALPPPATRRGSGLAAVAWTAVVVAWLATAPAFAQTVPWGWDSAGPAKAVWTPQNLADYLLTGQTPHPAVARIIAPESSSTSLGSGVLVDINRSQGLVLTNWHVVRDSRSAVLVQFPDGFQSAGTVVRWDEAWDLAALVIWKPRATPVTIASAPPAIITSASPYLIRRAASPIACAPVAQAVTTEWFGPLKPKRMLTCPEIRLISAPGMKKGDTRLGPRSLISTAVSAIEVRPPIPDPIITPVRRRLSSSSGSHPASLTA